MSSRLKNFLWLIAVLVIFTLITTFRGETGLRIDFGENSLTLAGPDQFSYSMDYNKIESISLIELPETGHPVNGDENRRYQWGTYENNTLGEYTLWVTKKIENALLVTMQSGDVVVFNYESKDTTVAILDMFNELLETHNANTAS